MCVVDALVLPLLAVMAMNVRDGEDHYHILDRDSRTQVSSCLP
jgi:hypothetical protein